MRNILLTLTLLVSFNIQAQIAAVDTDRGTTSNRVTDIVVVFKMHVDIGYTNWAEGVLQKYCNEMLEETLKSLDETADLPKEAQFVWTIPGWPLKYMLEYSSPDKSERLAKAIKEGRIVPHALPVTFETEASDLESLVRGLSITSEINRKFGLPEARDAKLTDVPSHSWALPTVLKNAGVDFLHLGCNPGSASPDVPVLFWWQGPDSTQLLTFYWAEYYGSGILPPKDWPYKTWLAMIHTHENTGAPSPEEVAELLKSAKEELPDVNIRIGRLSDFYDLLMQEDPEIPVVTGDMPDTWIHGYLSKPRETRLSKYLQRETYNTEILNTQLNHWTGKNNTIKQYINDAVENMILYDEHTFGIALSHGNQHKWTYDDAFKINKSLGYYDYAESSWEEKANRIRAAERIIIPVRNKTMKALASNVGIEGKRIVVYNPLPWARSGRVTMFDGVYQKNFRIKGLRDLDSGTTIPVYEDYNLLSFDVDEVPAMGYKTYIPVTEIVDNAPSLFVDEQSGIIENEFFRLKIDKQKGSLSSVFDKQTNMQLVDLNSDTGFGQYFLERPGNDKINAYNKSYIKPGAEGWAYDEMIRPPIPLEKSLVYQGICERIVYHNLENALRATIFGKLNDLDDQKYLVSYTLYANQPYIEITWGVDGKKPSPLPEAGWLAFPSNLENPAYRLYRTGGIVDPTTDFINNTNHDYYFLNTSMTLFDDTGKGMAINSPHAPGISIDTPGLFQFSGNRELNTGHVYVNMFNNQWGTNFTEWIEGSFSSKLYIWSYGEYDSEKSFITPSEETRVPLKGVFFDGKKGSLPTMQEGLSLSRKGILVTSFRETDHGTELRLWEQAGNSGICQIKILAGADFKNAYPCNLRGEIIEEKGIDIIHGTFEVLMEAYHPASFILK
jgi:hypothetical protein